MKTTTKKKKEITLKISIPPSKHIGFINFINLALSQDSPVRLEFEKISKTGEREQSKIFGQFKFQGKPDSQFYELEEEIQEEEQKKKKLQQKRKQH